MKLIHCADFHLDSSLQTHLSPTLARERKDELLDTFRRVADAAAEIGAKAICICGDLFDKQNPSPRAVRTVFHVMNDHPDIRFFLLRGNHDNGILNGSTIPENLSLFGNDFTTYTLADGVSISGCEVVGSEMPTLSPLPAEGFHILMLHGAFVKNGHAPQSDGIRGDLLTGKHIDYLALGHYHTFSFGELDERGYYCYSGCPEGRGFDECGEKGFVVIDTESGHCGPVLIPCAQRQLYDLSMSVDGLETIRAYEERLEDTLQENQVTTMDMVRLTLTGSYSLSAEKDIKDLLHFLSERCYFADVQDESHPLIRAEDYAKDISLRGEFVRLVYASDLPQEKKEAVALCGLRVLAGEEADQ